MLPFGPIIAALVNRLRTFRKKLKGELAGTYTSNSQPEIIGFSDFSEISTPEIEAVRLSQRKIAEGEYELAKKILIDAWTQIPQEISNEPIYSCLREAFVKLYLAKGEQWRADKISALPTLLLDTEVRRLIRHPNQQLCGQNLEITEQDFEPPK